MGQRIFVAVIGVPVLIYVVLWAPGIVMTAALCFLAGVGAWELQRCIGKENPRWLNALSVYTAALIVLSHYPPLFSRTAALSAFVCTAAVTAAFARAIAGAGEIRYRQIAETLLGGIAIGYSFSSFLRLDALGLPRAYLLLPFILSFACDTFAYFTGLTLGKHKLAPKVSPKKTVEGSAGGLAGNVLCGLLFAWVMNGQAGPAGYGHMALLALICGVVAQIGDLSFSLIKREFGVKDYGRLFLAHGGVLDRFDSVLFVAPALEVYFKLISDFSVRI